MRPHQSAILGFAAMAVFAASANAADLFVAGTVGEVYKGDSVTGGFEPFGGICLGPVQALAADDSFIYAGDLVGGVVRFDLTTGAFMGAFFAPDTVTAMVMHDGDLLISDPAGNIHRVDPVTGSVESTMQAPFPLDAMHLIGSDLYIGTGFEGSVWKGDAVHGQFQYFGCGCAGLVQGFASDDEFLYATDALGMMVYYDLENGALVGEGFLPFQSTSIAVDGDVVLISDTESNVHRVDPVTYEILDTLPSPITIQAILMGENGASDCAADVTGDGVVDVNDLVALILAWGSPDAAADIDGNGVVAVNDLVELITAWGDCP